MSHIFRFPGGIHPKEGKGGKVATAGLPIAEIHNPTRVVIPLQQHMGPPCKPLVQKGDLVKLGQQIGEPVGPMSAAVHASVSGMVVACEPCILADGTQQLAVVIDNDYQDSWVELSPVSEPEKLTTSQLAELARNAGIAGMGGATFPYGIKLSIPPNKKVDTLILNGAECEPYLSADHRLMLEKTEEIVKGALVIQRALGIPRMMIGIEQNKPDAVAAMEKASSAYPDVEVFSLPTLYPQGGEKQLVYTLTKRIVPAGGLPLDVGALVCNVGSCYALHRAVYEGRPVVDRVVTVGGSVGKPGNYAVPLGTAVELLLEMSDWLSPDTRVMIYGGAMMGKAISRQDIPVTKGCSGIVALDTVGAVEREDACIRCSRCVTNCPMRLSPTDIDKYMRKDLFEEAEKLDVMSCLECGACSWSCPSRRNLTQSCRTCKKIITQRRKEAAVRKGDQ